jgi:succinyl-diaminopimelate desuccinylase
LYLRELRAELHGRLTLSAVSDEETFGPYGARYLSEHHPEIFGDSRLSGEPSSPWTLRFGEKGPLWLEFTVRTKGAHGAYTHASKSATAIAAKIIGELEILGDIPPPEASNLAAALDAAAPAIDRAQGEGAAMITRRVTVNPGIVHGGLKVNMVASECRFEVDIRLPNAGSTRRRSWSRSTRSSRPTPKSHTGRSSTTRRVGARPTPRWRYWCGLMPGNSPASTRPR